MTDARPKQIQDIEALLAERRKYEQWIAQLETRKESTPSHVYVKVHRDYTVRLDEAQQKLSSETGAVNALASELEASLAGQERQIGERTDERAEAELRASVGEFAGKEWDKLRGKLDSAIAELAGERDSIQRELDTLRALLGEAEAPASAATKSDDVDDIAFLRSVLGRATPYSTTPPPPTIVEAPSAPRPAPAPRASVPVEKRPSVVQPGQPIAEAVTAPAPAPVPPRPSVSAQAASPPPPPVPVPAPAAAPVQPRASAQAPAAVAAPAPAPVREAAPAPVPVAPRISRITTPRYSGSATAIPPAPKSTPEPPLTPLDGRGSSAGPRATDDAAPARPSGTFGHLTPRTSEAIKSLKCQECGTLNFPTEWYCERCGGELAAF
jgi:hypothetical protein